MAKLQLSFRDEKLQEGVPAVYFDSRIDKTRISKVIDGKNFANKTDVDHYVMVQQPSGELMGIFTPEPDSKMTKAEVVARCVLKKLESLNVDLSKVTALGKGSKIIKFLGCVV